MTSSEAMRPKRMRNGMILWFDGVLPTGRKWIEVTVTNSWPIISLGTQSKLITKDGSKRDLSDFDHLSLPPDLRLHVSGSRGRQIMFDRTPVDRLHETGGSLRWFTFIGNRIAAGEPIARKVYQQCALLSPALDDNFDPLRTRLFVDAFLHVGPFEASEHPFAMPGMRAARDRRGGTFGPFSFESLQRRLANVHRHYVTWRCGFIESDEPGTVVDVPLAVYNERTPH